MKPRSGRVFTEQIWNTRKKWVSQRGFPENLLFTFMNLDLLAASISRFLRVP